MFNLTLKQVQDLQKERLNNLIDEAGSLTHLSRMLNLHIGTVQGWHNRSRISKKGAELVEKHPILGKNYTAIYLRPDLDC